MRQHIALVVTLVLGWAVWWWWRPRELDLAIAPARRAVRIAARVGIALVALVGLYVVAVMVPRPMAALRTAGPAILIAIDFHAHTRYSHDGRWNWEAEDVRRWHRKAGFDVAYISDHRTFEGAREGWANNPTQSGDGDAAAPGDRGGVAGRARQHPRRRPHVPRHPRRRPLRDVDTEALALASLVPGNEPVLIETIPGNLSQMVVAAKGRGTPGVRAIELDRRRSARTLAGAARARAHHRTSPTARTSRSSRAATTTAGAHAASGWTLHRPSRLARRCRPRSCRAAIASDAARGRTRRDEGGRALRRRTRTRRSRVPFTVPLVAWGMLRTLSLDERIVWFAWIAALLLLSRVQRHAPAHAG